jgi:hypothetical protein
MIIKNEDIRGYRIDGEIRCLKHLSGEEEQNLTEDQIITNDQIGEDKYFCDECKEEL